MKFLVDELPYYGDRCPFDEHGMCWARNNQEECPCYWDKYKVCSDENPHECVWLKEVGCSDD